MEIVYPPVGIAHIVERIPDLLSDRVNSAASVRIACIMQPKSEPHFGSAVVILSAFALAQLLHGKFQKNTTVLVDILDNAPGETIIINGVEYTRCLSHQIEDGRSVADWYTEPIKRLAGWASSHAQIPVETRRYAQIQAQPGFRQGLVTILSRISDFTPMFSPSEGVLRIRPICSSCGMVDKTARTVRFSEYDRTLGFLCAHDGPQTALLDNPSDIIDANAPIRTVLRSLCFHQARKGDGVETVILNGGDWAGEWMQRVYFDGLSELGCTSRMAPFNMFTPQILDRSGAKLSKTIYLSKGAYADISPAWTSITAFEDRFGGSGLTRLWEEITGWVRSPKLFFRNYSVDYFEHLFSSQQNYPAGDRQ